MENEIEFKVIIANLVFNPDLVSSLRPVDIAYHYYESIPKILKEKRGQKSPTK